MKVTLVLFLLLFVVQQIFSDDSDSNKSGSDSLAPRYLARKSGSRSSTSRSSGSRSSQSSRNSRSSRRRSGVRTGDSVNNSGGGSGLVWWETCLIVLGCLFVGFLLCLCSKSDRSGHIPSYNSYRQVLGENPTGSALEEGQGDLGGAQGDLSGGVRPPDQFEAPPSYPASRIQNPTFRNISSTDHDSEEGQVDLGEGVRPPDHFDAPPSYPASSIPEPSQNDPPPPSYNDVYGE